jgi:hypothetical protein
MALKNRILRAYAAVRNYRKRTRADRPPYVPPPDIWGTFSDEFTDEFHKVSPYS